MIQPARRREPARQNTPVRYADSTHGPNRKHRSYAAPAKNQWRLRTRTKKKAQTSHSQFPTLATPTAFQESYSQNRSQLYSEIYSSPHTHLYQPHISDNTFSLFSAY